MQAKPKRIGKFYAVTDYKPDSKVNIEYNWSVLDSDSYLTGFRIETFSDSSFTTPVTIDTYEIKKNINVTDYIMEYQGLLFEVNAFLTNPNTHKRIILQLCPELRFEENMNSIVRSFKYTSKYPHAGAGKRVQF